jgi:hypothetical protein
VNNGLGQAIDSLHQSPLGDGNFGVVDLEILKLFVHYVSGFRHLPLLYVAELLHIAHSLLSLHFGHFYHFALRGAMTPPHRRVDRAWVCSEILRCILQLVLAFGGMGGRSRQLPRKSRTRIPTNAGRRQILMNRSVSSTFHPGLS